MSDAKGKKNSPSKAHKIAAPKGTRDAYPEDVLRRRYVTQAWRDAAIRCGFDEIEGPTFEAAELYAVKSGDGILSELFQAFSGKSPEEVERVRQEGKAPYALRPEFTPTLARMYAAKAKQLPQPCKWFTAGPYFRAEKPQRGRLREFLQWNCDVIGLPGGEGQYAEAQSGAEAQRAEMDSEVIAPIVDLMHTLGFVSDSDACDILVRFNHRVSAANLFRACGVEESQLGSAFELADRRSKMDGTAFTVAAQSIGFDVSKFDNFRDAIIKAVFYSGRTDRPDMPSRELLERMLEFSVEQLRQLNSVMQSVGAEELFAWDPHIVRGLAYYTGTVFEVIADGERAVAGGGRYDNLIELFGGPPTPACGFGMGDVVLSNLLDDKGLFPEGRELMEAVSRPPASVRPEAFVIHNGSDEARALVRPLVAAFRRGVEAPGFDGKPWSAARYDAGAGGVRPVHARQSYKATGKSNKLFEDAKKQHAMYVIEIGEGGAATLKSVDRNEAVGQEWSVDPASEAYVGRGLVGALGR